MKTNKSSLIIALYSKEITKEEFIKEYFKDVPCTNEYVMSLIQEGIENDNTGPVEHAILLLSTDYFPINFFTEKLCELLQYPWHPKHEDIAMFLKEIADPGTVDCLYQASELKFEYLDYDDTYQFGRKCIKAISAIGDENAIDKLKILASSETPEIAAYARKELRYKGLL